MITTRLSSCSSNPTHKIAVSGKDFPIVSTTNIDYKTGGYISFFLYLNFPKLDMLTFDQYSVYTKSTSIRDIWGQSGDIGQDDLCCIESAEPEGIVRCERSRRMLLVRPG